MRASGRSARPSNGWDQRSSLHESETMKPAFAIPLDTAPMEAKAQDALPDDIGQWQYEPKWDGFRCLAFKAGNVVELRAKSGSHSADISLKSSRCCVNWRRRNSWSTARSSSKSKALLSFDALQMRLHPAASRIQKLSIATPAKLILFDMLANSEASLINRYLLRGERLWNRSLRLLTSTTLSYHVPPRI